MTAEEAEEIYYKAYQDLSGSEISGLKPLEQRKLRTQSWQAVVDAFNKESDLEWAKRYLALQESYKHSTYKFNVES